MPRTVDIPRLKAKSVRALAQAMSRYDQAKADQLHYLLLRWIAQMTVVEVHSVWEQYTEGRLVAALNHNPSHFLKTEEIKGVSRVSSGLALYIIRGGGRYFDFRSTSDLLEKGDRWLGKSGNPFRSITADERAYIDTLIAIRNCVVHRSDAAVASYKRSLKSVYGIVSAPEAEEFLNTLDYRASSPARRKSRLHGLVAIVTTAIQKT
jgi:hypothetical protein